VMYTPPVCSPAPNVVPTYRRAQASRDTGVVARQGRADSAVITLGRIRMRTFGLDEPHRGERSVAIEVGESTGDVFQLLLRYLRYAGSHTRRTGPPRSIETSSSRDLAPRR
jgi:hypothetical protein